MLRQRDIKRMFSYSSIEHMGIATFAFGLGGATATYGALLHMLMHSLTKSSIFFTVGHACQMHRTQEIARIKGLLNEDSFVGWALMLGAMALAGLPPFGIFTSEFLILTATIKDVPLLMPFILVGLGVAFAGLLRKVQYMVSGDVPSYFRPIQAARTPVILHMVLVVVLAFYMPDFLNKWFQTAVELLK
ncbi:proton-conducting transporter membrane subunit [Candidatus Magnetobacterium casense]|uniref:NADH:quinone oxidoreductase/Mrp antiporter transmembrane domain-containing protein n=1 Tax=Candidatus Magnetobacterium casense TaxID=1455061 RepID=A0ABS6S2K4_9BACT|nr:proton-conducting transporter membrane subunit [Candidatus Magnetobacterium casensis]MBV6343066.1 hypothetical protein [Candidatus Magnetobacterium casensis]